MTTHTANSTFKIATAELAGISGKVSFTSGNQKEFPLVPEYYFD